MFARTLFSLALASVALAGAARAADNVPPPRLISVAGEAVVYVTPTEVDVTFGIETFNSDLDKATTLNADNGARLVKAITALGIEKKDIHTDNLQVQIEYRSNHVWEGVQGYIARRSYQVKLKDTKLFEQLVDAALKNGANQILGIEFRTAELRKYRDQARTMAIRAAKEKATDLAKEVNCGIGNPQSITEGSVGFLGGYPGRYANMMQNAQNFAAAPAGGEEAEGLPLGQIGIHAQVSVTFDLRIAPPQTAP